MRPSLLNGTDAAGFDRLGWRPGVISCGGRWLRIIPRRYFRPVRRYWWASLAVLSVCGCTQVLKVSPNEKTQPFLTGAFVGDGNWEKGYDLHTKVTGRSPQLMLAFVPWRRSGNERFPERFCRFAWERNAVPILTWEPWEPWTEWYPLLADVADGRYDRYLVSWAQAAKCMKGPILLRFAHEMNGDWYPWSYRKDARQRPVDYVAAWRHVYGVFRRQRADNVQFVWSPNFEPTGQLDGFYPGDRYVDWIGVDVYNQPRWPRDPATMIDPVCRFAERRGKPVILTEVGCAERFSGPDGQRGANRWAAKDFWISELFLAIAERPAIRGLVWFDVCKEADWRLTSSASATTAYRRGLAFLDSRRARN